MTRQLEDMKKRERRKLWDYWTNSWEVARVTVRQVTPQSTRPIKLRMEQPLSRETKAKFSPAGALLRVEAARRQPTGTIKGRSSIAAYLAWAILFLPVK
jgi:hypothetical protein